MGVRLRRFLVLPSLAASPAKKSTKREGFISVLLSHHVAQAFCLCKCNLADATAFTCNGGDAQVRDTEISANVAAKRDRQTLLLR